MTLEVCILYSRIHAARNNEVVMPPLPIADDTKQCLIIFDQVWSSALAVTMIQPTRALWALEVHIINWMGVHCKRGIKVQCRGTTYFLLLI